jgi:hypothetical protein
MLIRDSPSRGLAKDPETGSGKPILLNCHARVQEYALTQKGRELLPVLVALRQWGESHLFSRGEKRLQVLDKRTRKPPRLEVQNAKGEIFTADDLELVTVKN